MIRVRFWAYANDLEIEFHDDCTEKDIQEEFQFWFDNEVSSGWEIIEE